MRLRTKMVSAFTALYFFLDWENIPPDSWRYFRDFPSVILMPPLTRLDFLDVYLQVGRSKDIK